MKNSRLSAPALALLAGLAAWAAPAAAHDIPSRVTVRAFVKPEGERLTVLLRVPMEAFGEIAFPLRGPGFLRLAEAGPAAREAARVYLSESLRFYENGVPLTERELRAARIALPSSRAFAGFDAALGHVLSPPLDDSVDLFWRQGLLDVLVEYAIGSEDSDFAVDPRLGTLSDQTTTVLRFLTPDGAERAFNYAGDPGLVELDPRWHQAALRFVGMGFEHILEGVDHLLFLFCLVIPLRSVRALVPVVTSFTVAHSITLIAAAFGMAPSALWFPPLIETLIALSIVYMAFENIVGAKLRRRWLTAFGFGLVHGFGFSFLFGETLQFAGGHLLSSLLAFNVGVELGQLAILALAVPALNLLFRFAVDERVGAVLLSALLAHSAWHWMVERGGRFALYPLAPPAFDALFLAALARWLMLLVFAGAVAWGMGGLFRRLGLTGRAAPPEDAAEAGRRGGAGRGFPGGGFRRDLTGPDAGT